MSNASTNDINTIGSVGAYAPGSIFAIGGRENLNVMEQFVALCGGSNAKLLVLSTASSEPERKLEQYRSVFRSLDVGDVVFFHPQNRSDASSEVLLSALNRVDGVFMTGGSQRKLTTVLANTPFELRMRERHRSGMHLGGTSAGAAALSSVMIAKGRGYSAARRSSIHTSPGFGFLNNIIVDQHFHERGRVGRLLAAVLCHRTMLGFGLDEDTAFLLDPNQRVSIFGSGSLTVVDGSQLEATDVDEISTDTPAGFLGMRMHVLTAGWTFDLKKRQGKKWRPGSTDTASASCAETG